MTRTSKSSPSLPVTSREDGVHHLIDSFRVTPGVIVVDGGPAFTSRSLVTVVMDPSSRLVLSCRLSA